MIFIDYKDRRPIYEQIVDKVEELIIKGVLQPDTQMPSVRAFSVELSINPNTIQKAYAELERRGFLYSVKGKGSFVCFQDSLLEEKRIKIKEEISKNVEEAKLLHISEEELISLVRNVYQKNKGGNEV